MNIKEFKVGDVITRNEPVLFSMSSPRDASWCGDRLIFEGYDELSKIIIFTSEYGICKVSYARDSWDEGWAPYPETLWKQVAPSVESGEKDLQ